jgi:hypothetical protein
MDTLVNGFWGQLGALQEYAALGKLVLRVAGPQAERGVVAQKKKIITDDDRQVTEGA